MGEEQSQKRSRLSVINERILGDKRLSSDEKMVYARISFFEEFWEKAEVTSEYLGLKAWSVGQAKRKLEKLGYIFCVKNSGRGKVYVADVNVETMEDENKKKLFRERIDSKDNLWDEYQKEKTNKKSESLARTKSDVGENNIRVWCDQYQSLARTKSDVGNPKLSNRGDNRGANREVGKNEERKGKNEKRHIGDSNESCMCNKDSNRKESLKKSEDLVEDKSLEETSLNENLAGVVEAKVVAEEVKEEKVPPAKNVGNSPSKEHSLKANKSSSKAGLDAEMVNGKGESKKKPRKGNKRVVFSPPSIEEVQAYCEERKNTVDAEKFWSYYESVGWKVGKNKMKSWKAAVITWERRNREWGNGNQGNQNTGLVRGDAMYEPRDSEDLTYQRMFEFWKKAIGASVPQTVSQVEACKALLADVGEEWVERMIVARAMSVKTPFTTKEVKGIQGFTELADRRSLMMSYYNEHWEKWKEQQRREQLGKKPWEV